MSNSSRIAKNTLALYFRQILIMLVSLYTVRVVLNTLGAQDYGIYNVVAGVVVLFSFVNNAMATSVQRFLNFYLGKNDTEKTQNVYSASLVIHGVICLIFIVLAETAGLWFVKSKLNIPDGRGNAAFCCYQTAVVTTLANIMRVPYNAVIISYEKMTFFAGLSIVEAVLKLAVVFLLKITPLDKLVFYSFLIAAVSFIILFIYKFYCNKNFEIARYRKTQDKGLKKELVSFCGWSLFGAVANVANSQGTNIFLNIFTNVTVNAAMGIANQVNAAVNVFVSSFQTAFNPRIVKFYAEENRKSFFRFIERTVVFSYFLQLFIVVPFSVNVDFVLRLWLKNPPAYSSEFVLVLLVDSLIAAVNGPLWTAVQASGKIRFYQIAVSILVILNIPADMILLYFGLNPVSVFIAKTFIDVFVTVFRFAYMNKTLDFHFGSLILKKIVPSFLLGLFSFLLCFQVKSFFTNEIMGFLVSCFASIFINGLIFLILGLERQDRKWILNFARSRRW